MNELHEAAERLRNGDGSGDDQDTLAMAMLRELDPTPVCESALGAFAFVTDGVSLESEDGGVLLVQTAQDESGFSVRHHLESIGHLRTLCRALGIELKE